MGVVFQYSTNSPADLYTVGLFYFYAMAKITIKKRENPFVIVDKRPLNDNNLSWKAKGILSYLLSLPDDWSIYITELTKRSKDGKDSTSSGVQELIDSGYITRVQSKKEKGKFAGYDYTVSEIPQRIIRNGKPVNGKPATTNNNSSKEEGINNKGKKAKKEFILPEDKEFIAHGDAYLKSKLKAKYNNLKGPKYWLEFELGQFKEYWEELGWKRKGKFISPKRSFSTWMGNWVTSSKVNFHCIIDPMHPMNQNCKSSEASVYKEEKAGVYDRKIPKGFNDDLEKPKQSSHIGNKLGDLFSA